MRETLQRELKNVSFEQFLWSGGNHHAARLAAGGELRRFLDFIRDRDPKARHIVIAHSHGGNVAYYALRKDDHSVPISGLVCLATPFLDATRRDLDKTLGILNFATPLLTLGISFFITLTLAVFSLGMILDYLGLPLQKLGFLSVGLFLYVVLSLSAMVAKIATQKSRMFASNKFPLWINNKADKIQIKLKLPSLSRTPVFAAAYSADEAAWGLGLFQRVAAIPFILWNRPSSILATILNHKDYLWKCILISCGFVLMACVLIKMIWNVETVGHWVLFATWVYTVFSYFVMCSVLALLIFILLMLTFPIIRSHRLAFGGEMPLDNLLVRISSSKYPPTNDMLTMHRVSKAPSRRDGLLKHCIIYNDEEVIQGILSWIHTGIDGECHQHKHCAPHEC